MNIQKKTVIVVAGPTASGKTDLAIQFANHFKTEIISADSRQCFKELNIGVAKPSREQLQQVKHHFISSHSIYENVNAQTFEAYALQAAGKIFQQNDFVIMAGGTGLYITAFCEGLDLIPQVAEHIRKSIIENYQQHGLPWLQAEIRTKDPVFWDAADQKNPHRLIRALEIFTGTGKSITSFQQKNRKQRPFGVIKIALNVSKEALKKNIDCRTDLMIKNGLLLEAESLFAYKDFNALRTVGYRELYEYLEDKISLQSAVDKIKAHTIQYAKRQMTWFKKDQNIQWILPNNPIDFNQIISSIRGN